MKIKKLIFGLILLMFSNMAIAQISGINYKAIVRDNNGNAIINTTIQVRFSIIQETGSTTIYVEDHSPTTDSNGIIAINIGEGSTVSGNINIEDWGNDNHFLNIQIDIGSGLVDMGTTQFKSVPYAFYALNSGDHLGDTWNGTGALSINTIASGSGVLNINNSTSSGDGIQIGSVGNDGITIDSAGSVGIIVDEAGSDGIQVLNSGQDAYQVSTSAGNGLRVTSAGTNGVRIDSADNHGILINSAGDHGIQINAGGDNGIRIGSSVNNAIYIDQAGLEGLHITEAQTVGVHVQEAGTHGGYFVGTSSGVLATSDVADNPDIILGGTANTASGDDGIISSDPNYVGSDIFLKSNDAVVVQVDQNNAADGDFQIRNGLNEVVFRVTESGTIQQNGSTIHASDRRLKKDIADLSYGLNEILQLKPKSYHWKNGEQEYKSFGLIAQDLQPIIKEIISTKDDEAKTLGISYTEIIPVLIKAIQEQQLIINQQKEENTTLKSQIFERLERLEAVNNH